MSIVTNMLRWVLVSWPHPERASNGPAGDSSEEDIGIPAAKRVKSSKWAMSGQLDLLQDEELALHLLKS